MDDIDDERRNRRPSTWGTAILVVGGRWWSGFFRGWRKCGGERVGGFLGGERERERIEFKFNIENQRRI